MARRLAFVGALRHAKAADAAVSAKIVVHAGPNSQSGGCHHGLSSDWYHGPMSVVIAPIPPIAWAITNAIKNDFQKLVCAFSNADGCEVFVDASVTVKPIPEDAQDL